MFATYNQREEEEFVRKYLTPERLTTIGDCVLSAIERYREKQREESHLFQPRTKATIINDYIVDKIKSNFDNKIGLKCYYIRKQTFRLSIGDGSGAVTIRFKKMDRKMKVHNIPTQQALAFNEQPTLFGPTVNINAGYVTDGLDNRVFVACPESNSSNRWVWEIELAREDKPVQPILTITPTPAPQLSPSKRHVAPRKGKLKGHEDVK